MSHSKVVPSGLFNLITSPKATWKEIESTLASSLKDNDEHNDLALQLQYRRPSTGLTPFLASVKLQAPKSTLKRIVNTSAKLDLADYVVQASTLAAWTALHLAAFYKVSPDAGEYILNLFDAGDVNFSNVHGQSAVEFAGRGVEGVEGAEELRQLFVKKAEEADDEASDFEVEHDDFLLFQDEFEKEGEKGKEVVEEDYEEIDTSDDAEGSGILPSTHFHFTRPPALSPCPPKAPCAKEVKRKRFLEQAQTDDDEDEEQCEGCSDELGGESGPDE